MKQKLILSILGLLFSLITFGQEKIYYDENWAGCTKSKASFYRIANFDKNGNPIGEVRDYYITGELQGKADSALKIDKINDEYSVFIGEMKGYYKYGGIEFRHILSSNGDLSKSITYHTNGEIESEVNYENLLKNGIEISYNKNGIKERTVDYNKGIIDGKIVYYHENGTVRRIYDIKNDEHADKFYTECDEFEYCQKVFYEIFKIEGNPNEWPLVTNEENNKSSIILKSGLLMETKTKTGFKQTINIPLKLTANFSIETITNLKSGDINSGHGLIWGFKDWDNYNFFYINANGFYKIGSIVEGKNHDPVDWTETASVNKNYAKNNLKIIRINEEVYFSINGDLVHTLKFQAFHGNNIGYSIASGPKSVLFENLIVKQDIEN